MRGLRITAASLANSVISVYSVVPETGAGEMSNLIALAEQSSLRESPLNFAVGDTVDVHTRILEGDKERIQIFSGVVIGRRGTGTRETFTVRRIVSGEGVERTFPIHSPKVADVVVKRHGKVRRAKLYYLRERSGKSTRLRERRGGEDEGGDE